MLNYFLKSISIIINSGIALCSLSETYANVATGVYIKKVHNNRIISFLLEIWTKAFANNCFSIMVTFHIAS